MKKPNETQEKVIIKPRPPQDATVSTDPSTPCTASTEESAEGPAAGPVGGQAPCQACQAEAPAEKEK